MKETEIIKSPAIIVSIAERGSEVEECERSLDELSRLLDTAGGEVFARVIQIKDSFDPRTCIGSGKVKEISELCSLNEIKLVIFDFELSPAQIRNLENDIGGGVTVIDRSMLILDIFALHAVSGEGKLQVELAQLLYYVFSNGYMLKTLTIGNVRDDKQQIGIHNLIERGFKRLYKMVRQLSNKSDRVG